MHTCSPLEALFSPLTFPKNKHSQYVTIMMNIYASQTCDIVQSVLLNTHWMCSRKLSTGLSKPLDSNLTLFYAVYESEVSHQINSAYKLPGNTSPKVQKLLSLCIKYVKIFKRFVGVSAQRPVVSFCGYDGRGLVMSALETCLLKATGMVGHTCSVFLWE